MDEILAGIDVGTSKTAVIIAESTNESLNVQGFGVSQTSGVVRGIVTNIEKAERGIFRALSMAEKQAQLKVKQVVVSFGGSQTKMIKSHGVITIPKERGTVNYNDRAKLIESAKSVPLPQDAQIIDYAINDFIVDGARGIDDPIGMSASKLEGDVLLFVTQTPTISNLMKALENANVIPTDIIVSPLASANAVLTDEEKELGVILIDIGAGNTDAVIYQRNHPQFVTSVPYAGESVTHDLMVGLKLPKQSAEELKQKQGCALKDGIVEDIDVKIMGIGGREPRIVKKSFISVIIEARLEEILSMVAEQINKNGIELNGESFPAGIVLTGGTTLTSQIVFLVERILKLPVRIGLPGDRNPIPDGMNTPDYHIAWGSLLIASQRHNFNEMLELDRGKFPVFWNRIKNWVLKKL
ncbi:cell division protein FtsA [bacterium]|nr:cell division protein FtsA [bacterium]